MGGFSQCASPNRPAGLEYLEVGTGNPHEKTQVPSMSFPPPELTLDFRFYKKVNREY